MYAHMFELRDVRAWNINQWSIGVDDAIRDQGLHPKVIVLDSKTLKIPPSEDQRPEILIDRPQERLGGGMMETGRVDMLVAPVAVDSHIIPHPSLTRGTESFDGKDIAFFHPLGACGLHEGDLFVAVDMVA